MRYIKLLPVIFLLLDACTDPLPVSIIHGANQLVVDGLITNDPGPYQVKLFYATQLDKTVRRPDVESGASVWILEEGGGMSEKLKEALPGTYQTDVAGIRGQIGKSYQLRIITRDGKTYETTYQKLYAPGSLDSLYTLFDPGGIVSSGNAEVKDGIKILVDARGVQDVAIHYRWRWTAVNKVKSFPELRTINTPGGPMPDPEPCSGYIAKGLLISKVGECTCCICWSTRFSDDVYISENNFVKDSDAIGVNIGELALNSILFYDRLYIEVEQLSLSDEAYNFWKKVDFEQKAAGNLFQPNAIRIPGNVYSVSDPNEEVLGIFTASGIERRSRFFDKSIVPYELLPIDTIPHDCQDSFLNATLEKPSFW